MMIEVAVKLSLCMIVKNEAAVLSRCLSSVKNLVDEIVVIDTGSTDSTKKIAAGFGAKVHDYVWNDNFSDVRNYALEIATGEWILVLDADEILTYESAEAFVQLLKNPKVEGYFLRIVNILGETSNFEASEDLVVRLFRNKPEYRFKGAIHEQVRPDIVFNAGENALKKAPLTIYHDGYLSAVIDKKNKISRNIRVIRQALTENTANPFLLYSLGCEYFLTNEFTSAWQTFKEALALIAPGEGYLPDLVFKTGLCLFRLNKMTEMRKLFKHYIELIPYHPELLYLSGMSYFDHGELAEAEQNLKDCLAAISQGSNENPGIGNYLVYQALGEIKEGCACPEEAINYYFLAAQAKPDYLYPLKKLINLYQNTSGVPDILPYLDFCPAQAKIILLKKLNWLNNVDLVIYLILGITYNAIKSDPGICQELLAALIYVADDNTPVNHRIAATIYLVMSIKYMTTYSFQAAGNLSDIVARALLNIKDLLFCKEV